jgi:predicted phosphodiesterase
MKIIILGDVHGDFSSLHRAVVSATERYGIEAAIQVGDFGFFPRTFKPIHSRMKIRYPVPLYSIRGNHEDHVWLNSMTAQGDIKDWSKKYNVNFMRDSIVTTIGGKKFGFIGGALNIASPQESINIKGKIITNYVNDEIVENTVRSFNKESPDFVISHSCPHSIGINMPTNPRFSAHIIFFVKSQGFYVGEDHDVGEDGLTKIWNRLESFPKHWFFGHFHAHKTKKIGDTEFWCVGNVDTMDNLPGVRPYILDTETGLVDVIITDLL